jgi:uncharacterized protein YndB with AHSA1/START domain
MASVREQALIAAPVSEVWALLEDPTRYADWNEDTVAETGAPTKVEKGSQFELRSKSPLFGQMTTTFKVEELDDLHQIKLRCQRSGYYSHWFLTEAQGQTFAEVELGVEPIPGVVGRVTGGMHTKSYLRRSAEAVVRNLRRAVEGGRTASPLR